MQLSVDNLNKNKNNFENKTKELITQLDSSKNELLSAKQRVDTFLTNLQTSYNTSENERLNQFKNTLKQFSDEFSKIKNDFIKENEKNVSALLEKTNKIIESMEGYKKQAAKILQIVSNTGFAGNYSKNADREKKSADYLRIISIIIFTVISGLAIWILFSFQSNGDSWQNSLIKILATSLLTGLATYTTRESNKHRKLEQKYRMMELELSSLDAFIENIPDKERNQIKTDLTRKLFCHDEEHNTIIDNSDKKGEENTISSSLLFKGTSKNSEKSMIK